MELQNTLAVLNSKRALARRRLENNVNVSTQEEWEDLHELLTHIGLYINENCQIQLTEHQVAVRTTDYYKLGVSDNIVLRCGDKYIGIYNLDYPGMKLRSFEGFDVISSGVIDTPGVYIEGSNPTTILDSNNRIDSLPNHLRPILVIPKSDDIAREVKEMLYMIKGPIAVCNMLAVYLEDTVVITNVTSTGTVDEAYTYDEDKKLWFCCRGSALIHVVSRAILDIVSNYTEEEVDGYAPVKFDYNTILGKCMNRDKAVLAVRSGAYNLTTVNNYIKGLGVNKSLGGLYDPTFADDMNNLHPYLYPCRDGMVIDLRTAELIPRTKEHKFSFEMPYTLPSRTEEELVFLREHGYIENDVYNIYRQIASDDEETRISLQKFNGYAISGWIDARIIALFYGEGSNGKGVNSAILRRLSGPFYTSASKDIFIDNSNRASSGAHTGHLIPLIGTRVAVFSESHVDEKLNEGLLKSISGGDPIYMRDVSQKALPRPVTLSTKLVLETNHLPNFDKDPSMIDRVRYFCFNSRFVDNPKTGSGCKEYKRDPEYILNMMRDSMDELLEYIVYGARLYYNNRINPFPQSDLVKTIVSAASEGMDPVGDFINEHVLYDPTKLSDKTWTIPKSVLMVMCRKAVVPYHVAPREIGAWFKNHKYNIGADSRNYRCVKLKEEASD